MFKKCLILLLIFSISSNSVCLQKPNEAHQAVEQFLKNSDLPSADLRKGCNEFPEFFHKIGIQILDIVFFVANRPENIDVDKAIERIKAACPQLNDFVMMVNSLSCYGEAIVINDSLESLSYESSQKKLREIDWAYFYEDRFKSGISLLGELITELGKRLGWSNEKISEEYLSLKKKIAKMIQNFDGNTCLSLKMHNMEDIDEAKIKSLEAELIRQKDVSAAYDTELSNLKSKLDSLEQKK